VRNDGFEGLIEEIDFNKNQKSVADAAIQSLRKQLKTNPNSFVTRI
jgi:hypothetical protein